MVVVPLAARSVAAAFGVLLILTTLVSVVATLIVPRPVGGWLTGWVHRLVGWMFRLVTSRIADYQRRDRFLAGEAASILVVQLVGWLAVSFVGYALLFWPFVSGGVTVAFAAAGSSLLTLGFAVPSGDAPKVVVCIGAATGLIIISLQIAYLPTLYSAFNRRETEVALLNARAGVPSWGPELLARTHYGLGTRISTLDTLPDLYAGWERWASDVAESHSAYLPLVRFRSPRPLSSWVTALLAMLDSAALFLALSPESAPQIPARLFLRSGFLCFNQIANAMGIHVPDEPDPNGQIRLTYQEFLDAVERLRAVDFHLERDAADAWPDFVGWRLNYEFAAYSLAAELDVVPALWSGPRRTGDPAISPIRPQRGRPPR
jgi:hypothetical protein